MTILSREMNILKLVIVGIAHRRKAPNLCKQEGKPARLETQLTEMELGEMCRRRHNYAWVIVLSIPRNRDRECPFSSRKTCQVGSLAPIPCDQNIEASKVARNKCLQSPVT
jgi:hypothetical protein